MHNAHLTGISAILPPGSKPAAGLGVVMACVESIAQGHVDMHHQTQECFCSECGVNVDDHAEHKDDCLSKRAADLLTVLESSGSKFAEHPVSAALLNTVSPRPLQFPLDAYWLAASGEGPLAAAYENKPHQIVYDLVAALLAQQLASAQEHK